jgi:hypothetical protein
MWTVIVGCWLVIHIVVTNKKAGRRNTAFRKQFDAKSWRATCITALLYIAGLAITALPRSLYTKAVTGKFLPSHTNITYALNVGKQGIPSELKTVSENTSEARQNPSVIKIFTTYGEKIVALFHPFEITNNINYYFMKHLLPAVKICLQPLLLIPLTVLGLVLIAIMPGGLQRYSPLYLYIVAHIIAITLFVSLSPYRLSRIHGSPEASKE